MQTEFEKLEGIVVSLKANYYFVDIKNNILNESSKLQESSSSRLLCTRRSRLDHRGDSVYVGDYVVVESIDWKESRGVISDVKPRKTLMKRPPVANITDIFVLISLQEPPFDTSQVSRFLLAAEQVGQGVNLVLTKKDLIKACEYTKHLDSFKDWGYKPIAVSLRSGEGIESLVEVLKQKKVSVFCGPSGVGKSSLLNYLIPDISLSTCDVSKKLKRGRHTTRHVELFTFGTSSLIADTPGFNRPELIIKPKNLANLFPEVRLQLSSKNCKFRNCLHLNEPGCALDKNWNRYDLYKEYLEEMITLDHLYPAD